MAEKKLDMTEPYGEVMGDANGCRYVQNGNQYNALGEFICKDGEADDAGENEQGGDTAGDAASAAASAAEAAAAAAKPKKKK